MADVSGITAVRPGDANTVDRNVAYGATIASGDVLYLNSTSSEYELADADALASSVAVAIAVTPGVDGGRGMVFTSGKVFFVGATFTVGLVYVVSNTGGKIMPEADLSTGEYATTIGRALDANTLEVDFKASQVALA